MLRTLFDLNLLANIVAKLGNIVGEHVKQTLTCSRTMLASLAIALEFPSRAIPRKLSLGMYSMHLQIKIGGIG